MSRKDQFEIIVVGAGIAGASVAAFLAERGEGSVLLLEREAQPAYHATGRSAAALVELNRHPLWRRLITLGRSGPAPPAGVARRRAAGRSGGRGGAGGGAAWAELQQLEPTLRSEGIATRLIGADEARALVPALDPGAVEGALLLPEDGHLDVHALLQGYLRRLARAGGEVRCDTEVREVLREHGRCVGVGTPGGPLRARWVVDAAGAWRRAGSARGRSTDCVPAAAPHHRDLRRAAGPRGRPVADGRQRDAEGLLQARVGRPPREPHGRDPLAAVRRAPRRRGRGPRDGEARPAGADARAAGASPQVGGPAGPSPRTRCR